MAPASSASSSQPPRPLSPTEDDSRPRLTEEERKRNHIKSEQKRRAALRVRFEKLTTIVPDTEGQARSEGLVLNKTLDHIVDLMNDRRKMVQTLEARGVVVDSKYKADLEAFPEELLDRQTDASHLKSASPGGKSDHSPAEGSGSQAETSDNEGGAS